MSLVLDLSITEIVVQTFLTLGKYGDDCVSSIQYGIL